MQDVISKNSPEPIEILSIFLEIACFIRGNPKKLIDKSEKMRYNCGNSRDENV